MRSRAFAAYLLMGLFVILTSLGFGMVHPSWGVIVAGIGCGIYGWLLGNTGGSES